MSRYFVGGTKFDRVTVANDGFDGRDNLGFGLSGASLTIDGGSGYYIITKAGAFVGYSQLPGDRLYCSSATGSWTALFSTIAKLSNDTIVAQVVVESTGTISDQTDVASSTGPRARWSPFLASAASTGIPTGTHILYIKGGQTYGGDTAISMQSRGNDDHITLEGWRDEPGDGAITDIGEDNRPLISTTSATNCVLWAPASSISNASLTLRNVNITAPSLAGSGNAMFKYGTSGTTGPDADFLLEFAKLNPSNASFVSNIFLWRDVPSVVSTRYFTVRDVVIEKLVGGPFSLTEVGAITIQRVTLLTNHSSFFLNMASSATSLLIEDINALDMTSQPFLNVGTGIVLTFLRLRRINVNAITGGFCVLQAASTNTEELIIEDCTIASLGGRFTTLTATTYPKFIRISRNRVTAAVDGFLSANGEVYNATIGQIIVEDNDYTMSAGGGISIGPAYGTAGIPTTQWRNCRIMRNRMIRTGSGSSHPLMVGINCYGCEIGFNTFVGSLADDFGAVVKAPYTYFHHNNARGRFALYHTTGRHCRFHNNSIQGTSTAAYVWGVNRNESVPNGTGANAATNGSATVTVAGSDLSKMQAGHTLEIVGRTDGLQGTAFFEITGVDNTAKTITVTPSPGADTNQTWWGWDDMPFDAIITDNIFDGSGGDSAHACRAISDVHCRARFDRNLYKAGTGGLFRNRGASQTTLSALQASWSTAPWADGLADNDANSIVGEPAWKDIANNDFSITSSSDAIDRVPGGFTKGSYGVGGAGGGVNRSLGIGI